jgi:hypothetical protein
MESINIYSELNGCLIRFIVTAHQTNNFRALHDFGLTNGQVERVASMSLVQVQQFNRLQVPIAKVLFDNRHFEACIDIFEKESSTDTIKDQMIKMDASAAMLDALAGMDIQDYRARRRRLGLDKPCQGRPSFLNSKEIPIVNKSWLKNSSEEDELLRYHKVGADTGLPLNKIWAYMHHDQ